jgi:hypothetical protein
MADAASSTGGQKAFAAALLDPDMGVPEGLVSPQGFPSVRRFAIYRNNVTVSLVTALSEVFPTVRNLVGEEFFNAMARLYVELHPPRSPLLFEYGQDFSAFIADFKPAGKLPFLPDVARLERLWLDSWHSADATPLDGAVLGKIAPERLAEVCFVAHPATRLFRGEHAAVTIVARDRQAMTLDGLDPYEREDGLITRPAFDPQIRHLPAGAADFIEALIRRDNLEQAANAAATIAPEFDLSGAIGAILQAGAFTSAILDGEEIA